LSVSPPILSQETKIALQVYQGKNITWEMPVVNIQDDTAVDITGAAIIFSVKERVADSPALFTRIVGTGIVIDPDQVTNKGKYQLSLIPGNTEDLEPQLYQCDVELTLNSKEQTIARGTLEVLDVVTGL